MLKENELSIENLRRLIRSLLTLESEVFKPALHALEATFQPYDKEVFRFILDQETENRQ